METVQTAITKPVGAWGVDYFLPTPQVFPGPNRKNTQINIINVKKKVGYKK